jgi:fructose-1-phosphate kinase PfkB-like protein
MQNNTLILGLNPAWQRLFITEKFELGEVHRLPKAVEFGSGKGVNCGRVLQLLGGNPMMMHFLGGSYGSCIFDELSASGIRQIPIWIQSPTRICTTVVSDGVTTELIEPSPVLSNLENEDFIQTLVENWEDVNRIVVCGSFPSNFDSEALLNTDLVNKRLFVDAINDIDKWLEKGVELLKLNANEYFKLLQHMSIPQVTSSPQFWKITASTVLERLPIHYLVVTDEEGPVRVFFMVEGKFQFIQLQPPSIKVVNSIGAGDSFLAGWLRADALDSSLEETICRATAVAVARCEVDRPWNLKLERVHQLEKELLPAIERISD